MLKQELLVRFAEADFGEACHLRARSQRQLRVDGSATAMTSHGLATVAVADPSDLADTPQPLQQPRRACRKHASSSKGRLRQAHLGDFCLTYLGDFCLTCALILEVGRQVD